ncbi:hypothetical protein [Lysobacter sp. F6437]|uniref:hypothetical protein n=1 Tax=Lysobacter sp. F6437 TaxID=3459296 RepID=UPI00403DEA9D
MALLMGTAAAGNPSDETYVPIQSRADLQRYLEATPIAESPLSRLSPMGRRRFLEDIHFTERGIGGYGFADLLAELRADEISEVLALFDLHASSGLLSDAREVNRNDLPSRWPVPQEPTAIGRKFDQLRALRRLPEDAGSGLTDAVREQAMHDGYERLFGAGPLSLAEVSDTDLDLLFRAANMVIGITNDPEYFDDMDRLLAELKTRNLVQKDHYRVMHEALVLTRNFDRADALARTHPSLELAAIPKIVDNVPMSYAGPTAWWVSQDRYQLVHQAVELGAPAMVIVTAHLGCGYSRDAMKTIESDPVLGPVFAKHANWLAPQDGRLDIELLQQWNREHPAVEMVLAVDAREWPAIDDWKTPTFYFFKNGELTTKVSGWPLDGAGHRDDVVAALGEIGLLE